MVVNCLADDVVWGAGGSASMLPRKDNIASFVVIVVLVPGSLCLGLCLCLFANFK